MARTSPAVVTPAYAGATPANLVPDATGDIVDPGTTLVVICGATGTTVTVDVTQTDELGRLLPDITVTVPASGIRVVKIPNRRVAGQPSDATVGPNKVLVNYSSVATVTRFVLPG